MLYLSPQIALFNKLTSVRRGIDIYASASYEFDILVQCGNVLIDSGPIPTVLPIQHVSFMCLAVLPTCWSE